MKQLTIESFYNGLCKFESYDKLDYLRVAKLKITDEHKELIQQAIALRNNVNKLRGIPEIEKYKRSDEKDIDLKAMTGEFMFSCFLLNLSKKSNHNITIVTPPIAEVILNKQGLDFELIDNVSGKSVKIDLKSQNTTKTHLNINKKSFERMKLKSYCFIYACVDNVNNEVTFYLIKNVYFEKLARHVDKAKTLNFTPFLSFDLSNLTKA